MKFLKGLITFFLILIIVGGTGFLGWNLINNTGMRNMGNTMNITDSNNSVHNSSDDTAKGNMQSDMKKNISFNTMNVENKDKLNHIITTINDALNQITIDPYSKVTLPSSSEGSVVQQGQGNTTVNVYPNGNNANGNATNTQMPKGNYVYNQEKLEQLHNGIFKLAQGRMILSELNDELTAQTNISYTSDYEGYAKIYNTILQNKLKLDNAINMINEASTLINVNPYASSSIYEYNTEEMKNLHDGIYKLAQGLLSGTKLSDDFTKQMNEVSTLANNTGSMANTNMGVESILGSLSIVNIIKGILVLMVICLFIALFGAVGSIFNKKAREH